MPTAGRSSNPASARRLVPASAPAIFTFLSDLENQCLLAQEHTDLLRLDGPRGARHGAQLRVRAPLALGRKARARIVARVEPSHLVTSVELGRTVVRFGWTLTPLPASTGVELTAEVASAGLLDRALLAAAGRRALARCLRTALDTLSEIVRVASAESGLDDARDCRVVLTRYTRR